MSVYNGERYIKESVKSILNQTEKDFEFIIINDGSTDGSLELLKEFERNDTRIVLISRENKGLVSSLNEGIQFSQGEYIARMDVDDISHIDRLEKQINYMKEKDLVLCGTFAEKIDSRGKKIGMMDYPPESDAVQSFSLLHNPFIHPSVIFKKDCIEKVGGYRSFFKHAEDYELWTRIIFKYTTGNIPLALLQYRIHDGQITNKKHLSMINMGIVVRVLALFRFLFRL
jgi:glycosyltransferase involved in cell wall biosynthesis